MAHNVGRSNLVGVIVHNRNERTCTDDFNKYSIIYLGDTLHLDLLNTNPFIL
jgi:hypothetical protein